MCVSHVACCAHIAFSQTHLLQFWPIRSGSAVPNALTPDRFAQYTRTDCTCWDTIVCPFLTRPRAQKTISSSIRTGICLHHAVFWGGGLVYRIGHRLRFGVASRRSRPQRFSVLGCQSADSVAFRQSHYVICESPRGHTHPPGCLVRSLIRSLGGVATATLRIL